MRASSCFRVFITRAFTVVLCFTILCGVATAGLITSVRMFGIEAGSGPGLGTVSDPVILTLNIDNDNQPSDPPLDNNITVPIKRFDHADYIDMVFNVVPTNGVTEYKFFESVDNNTGVNWSGYRMGLGFGVGAGFTLSPNNDGLDFDAPTYDTPPTSTAFANVFKSENLLSFSNGIHSSGAETYQFRVDVPNLRTLPDGSVSFTIRQTMIPVPIPEPSILVLLGLGLGGMLFAVRKR